MLRMQEMTFPGFKFQKFSGGVLPPIHRVVYWPHTWPSAIAIPL